MIETDFKPVASAIVPAIQALSISEESKSFQKSINACASNLFCEMDKVRSSDHKNFFFFTPNLMASYSMLYAGAPADLKPHMEAAFQMGEVKGEKWHKNFQAWSEGIQSRTQSFTQAASGLAKADQQRIKFLQCQLAVLKSGTTMTPEFKNNLSCYRPEIVDFSNAEVAKTKVNNWVSEKTEGKIKNIVEELSSDVVLVLASAALFKGSWVNPFDKKENSVETFQNSDGSKVKVTMMNMHIDQLKMAYDRRDNMIVEILELPFQGNVSLLLIDAGEDWKNMSEYMTPKNMQSLIDDREKRFHKARGLSIGIPKLDISDKTDLFKELEHTALTKKITEADFASMFEHTGEINTPQLVSEVKFVMDEEGAEVAAASYTPSNLESCDPYFKLNHPFGIAMIDNVTGTILAMGKILKLENNKI